MEEEERQSWTLQSPDWDPSIGDSKLWWSWRTPPLLQCSRRWSLHRWPRKSRPSWAGRSRHEGSSCLQQRRKYRRTQIEKAQENFEAFNMAVWFNTSKQQTSAVDPSKKQNEKYRSRSSGYLTLGLMDLTKIFLYLGLKAHIWRFFQEKCSNLSFPNPPKTAFKKNTQNIALLSLKVLKLTHRRG